MNNFKLKITDRLLSVLLIIVILVSAFPITVFADTEEKTEFLKFQVYDNNDKSPLDSAEISYEILEGTTKITSGNLITDNEGSAVIIDKSLDKYITEDKSLDVTYTVSKDGYKSKENKISITASVTDRSVVVELEKNKDLESNKVKIKFNKTGDGDGTITVNGLDLKDAYEVEVDKDSKVNIVFSAADESCIKSLSKGNIEITLNNKNSCTEDIIANSDVTYNVEFEQKEFSVTIKSNIDKTGKNCTINLGNIDISDNEYVNNYKSGKKIKLSISADSMIITGNDEKGNGISSYGYQISSVEINGNKQEISNNNYNVELVITSDTTIVINFAKTYTITLDYNDEQGKVQVDDTEEGNILITRAEKSSFTITAIPNDGYKLAYITYNNKPAKEFESHINNGIYKNTISINKNLTISVTFEPKEYVITINSYEKKYGIVDAPSSITYGGSYNINITTKDGYTLDSILINNKSYEGNFSYTEMNEAVVTVENVTAEQDITPNFKKIEKTLNMSEYLKIETDNIVWQFGNTYIFKKDAIFTITSDYKIRIYELDNSGKEIVKEIPNNEQFSISENTIISKIQVFCKLDDELIMAWHDISNITSSNPLNIGFDDKDTKIELNTETIPSGTSNSGENIYNKDVIVDISVTDKEISSGIKNISYTVTADGQETQSGDLYNFDYQRDKDDNSGTLTITDWDSDSQRLKSPEIYEGAYPTSEQLKKEWGRNKEKYIVIDSKKNNADEVVLTVTATDNAGKESSSFINLNINTDIPEFAISFDDNINANKVDNDRAYYKEIRTATLTVSNDRASSFDKDEAEKSIKDIIKVKDKETANYTIVWTNEPNESNSHKATITFSGDANYTIDTSDFSYTNKADNSSTKENITFIGDNTKAFTIDKTAPNAKVKIGSNNVWDKLLSTITFGLFGKDEVNVSMEYSDTTSPCVASYYIASEPITEVDDKTLDEIFNDLEKVKEIEPETNLTISDNQQFIIYIKAIDYAGNIKYISSDGFILDNNNSDIELSVETIPSGTGNSDENIYNKDVKVYISVTDKEISSGIKNISYTVTADGKETQSGDLYKFDYKRDKGDNSNSGTLIITDWDSYSQTLKKSEIYEGAYPTSEQLKKEWGRNKEKYIVIDSKKNNADEVVLTVTATDNAGKESSSSINLNINIDIPEFNISFDDIKANKVDNDRAYYKEIRTATLTVSNDRAISFDKDRAEKSIKDIIKVKDKETANYTIVWANEPNESSNHKATITFNGDANYTIDTSDFSYTNKAGNSSNKDNITLIGNNTKAFTIDTNSPAATVKIGSNVWDKILSTITFGLFGNDKVNVNIQGDDATSPFIIEYYKTEKPINGKDDKEIQKKLDAIYNGKNGFVAYEGLTVSPDEQFIIYARITDYAGNYIYVNSDGYIVDNTQSDITYTIDTQASGQHNEVNIYNSDVILDIKVTDNLSGIQSISYEITKDDKEITQSGILYNFDYKRDEGDNNNGGTLIISDWDSDSQTLKDSEIYEGAYSTSEQLKKEWEGKLKVYKNLNNSCNVKVVINVKDNAGNQSKKELKLDIDCTEPKVDIKFEGKTNKGAFDGYYTERTAIITVIERTAHFNGSNGIGITAVDINDKAIENAYTISKWMTVEDSADFNKAKHTATIKFAKDANYTFKYDCVDKANNKCSNIKTYKFTVDKTSPTGTLTAISAEGRKATWDNSDFNKSLTFGFWSNKKISISGTSNDITSPIAKVEYYKLSSKKASDGVNRLSVNELNKITSWKKFSTLDVLANEQFVVYAKLTDKAGNYSYIKTNGLIVDDQRPVEEVIAPEITITPPQPVNGIYNRNVKVSISVKDPLVGGTYSGLKNVSYKVFNNSVSTTEPTQEGILYTFDKTEPKQSELVQRINKEITVDSAKNNSNNVQIVVYATDNAGNSSDDDIVIKIDTTAPEINILYDNNNADSGIFFKQNRTATISISERNFNAKDVKLSIKNANGDIPEISPWTKKAGTGNLDNTIWTATITYSDDGDYEFGISYSDLAGNKCAEEKYASGTIAEKRFIIDKTAPIVSVSYDNNSVQNDMYYKADRTATVTIKEHNFDKSRIDVTINAYEADSGNALTSPEISEWTSSGNDKYTAKISYSFDAKFNFDISVKDKAGNKSADFVQQTFVVDKTAPELIISGVKDKSANNGDVIPIIKYSDVNFDKNQVNIKLDGVENNGTVFEGSYTDENSNGQTFTFNNFEKKKELDDIYILSASITDKAGNTTSKKIEFSVNRFGSTYKLSEATKSLNNSYVQEPIDVEISEINVDALKNITITVFKDNEAIILKENTDYKVNANGGNGKWYRYDYIIFAKNFSDDGVYRISVRSEDKAGNTAENTLDTKNMNISFGVDKTKPNIVITNIESGVTYAVDNIIVKISPEDNLLLENIKVYLDDYSKLYKNWTSDEIKNIVSKNGEFTFDIAGNSINSHKVKVVCTDAAGNEYAEEITDVFVTTNLFVRYYNNKFLFWGSICVMILIVLIIVFILVRKKYDKTKNKV